MTRKLTSAPFLPSLASGLAVRRVQPALFAGPAPPSCHREGSAGDKARDSRSLSGQAIFPPVLPYISWRQQEQTLPASARHPSGDLTPTGPSPAAPCALAQFWEELQTHWERAKRARCHRPWASSASSRSSPRALRPPPPGTAEPPRAAAARVPALPIEPARGRSAHQPMGGGGEAAPTGPAAEGEAIVDKLGSDRGSRSAGGGRPAQVSGATAAGLAPLCPSVRRARLSDSRRHGTDRHLETKQDPRSPRPGGAVLRPRSFSPPPPPPKLAGVKTPRVAPDSAAARIPLLVRRGHGATLNGRQCPAPRVFAPRHHGRPRTHPDPYPDDPSTSSTSSGCVHRAPRRREAALGLAARGRVGGTVRRSPAYRAKPLARPRGGRRQLSRNLGLSEEKPGLARAPRKAGQQSPLYCAAATREPAGFSDRARGQVPRGPPAPGRRPEPAPPPSPAHDAALPGAPPATRTSAPSRTSAKCPQRRSDPPQSGPARGARGSPAGDRRDGYVRPPPACAKVASRTGAAGTSARPPCAPARSPRPGGLYLTFLSPRVRVRHWGAEGQGRGAGAVEGAARTEQTEVVLTAAGSGAQAVVRRRRRRRRSRLGTGRSDKLESGRLRWRSESGTVRPCSPALAVGSRPVQSPRAPPPPGPAPPGPSPPSPALGTRCRPPSPQRRDRRRVQAGTGKAGRPHRLHCARASPDPALGSEQTPGVFTAVTSAALCAPIPHPGVYPAARAAAVAIYSPGEGWARERLGERCRRGSELPESAGRRAGARVAGCRSSSSAPDAGLLGALLLPPGKG
nr:uncharacterized protein LOC104847114 [Loxodonta africana]